MRLGIKKGLLFYGPPGTGKTHTVHYLASQMKDHTTLLITAIEFPLPDEEGRRKLIQLYSGGLKLGDELLTLLIQKTKGGSGTFIKELMRRSAQFLVESGEKALRELHIESALDEMLFSGGSLNAKVLGFSQKN